MTLHGAFANFEGTENVVNEDKIYSFERLAQKNLALATFSNNWFDGIRFPLARCIRLRKTGITPLVRIMPRSDFKGDKPDPKFSLQAIASGTFDRDLERWAQDCALLNGRVLIDFACEVNGHWFPWSKEDPTMYVKAHRRIYAAIKSIAPLAEFVWHVNHDEKRTNLAKYFPGSDYVDMIGASIYGNHKPREKPRQFAELAKVTFDNLELISAKPKCISEIGVTESEPGEKAQWIQSAFEYIEAQKTFQFVSWWHSSFTIKDAKEPVNYRIDSTPEALAAYREAVNSPNIR